MRNHIQSSVIYNNKEMIFSLAMEDENLLDDIADLGHDIAEEEEATYLELGIVTDELIKKSKLQPVTNPLTFNKGDVPTDDGLFSDIIFGTTTDERRRQFAYIDLTEKMFHPFVFEILDALIPRRFKNCAMGKGAWYITTEGELTEVKKTDDPNYDEDASGIKWLIKNYDKIKIKKTKSKIRAERIAMLKHYGNDIFITKWLVAPIAYRDIDRSSSYRKLPEINQQYNNLIRYSNSLKDTTFDFYNNQIRYNMQAELVSIRKYTQKLMEGKRGHLQQAILGKSIDRGSRDVISVPSFMYQNRPEDNPIDVLHVGIPLAKCLVLGYNFVSRFVVEFFSDNYRNVTEIPVYKKVGNEYKVHHTVKIKDPALKFTPQYVEKQIKKFMRSPNTRFEPVKIDDVDGNPIPIDLTLAGRFTSTNIEDHDASTIMHRPMTWTDLFYIASMETLTDKYTYVTRFPITSHNSIAPLLTVPMSTVRTVRTVVLGKEYPNYPLVDMDIPTNLVSTLFIDTLSLSNVLLAAYNGDYDGDMTGEKMAYSLEANKEAERISLNLSNFVSPNGGFIRKIGNEVPLCLYSMTREPVKHVVLSKEKKVELLKINKDELTVDSIAKLFANTAKFKIVNGKREVTKVSPKFDIYATFTLEANESTNKTKIETTVGRYLFNQLLISGIVDSVVPNGYYNVAVDKKNISNLYGILSKALINKEIQVDPTLLTFLKALEFWGLTLVPLFAPSYDKESIVPNKEVMALKNKLLKDRKDDSLQTYAEIEDQLVKKASDSLKNKGARLMFDSGARGSISGSFKPMSVAAGIVPDPAGGQFAFIKSSFIEGLKKTELPAAGNIIINAEYPKSKSVAEGGYMLKQILADMQALKVGKRDSNCGTLNGMEIVLTKETISEFADMYFRLPGTSTNDNILINDKLDSKYIGKSVILRSPMYCLNDDFCSKCVGTRMHAIEMSNIGVISGALAGNLMDANMSLRHNMSVKVNKVDINDLLL